MRKTYFARSSRRGRVSPNIQQEVRRIQALQAGMEAQSASLLAGKKQAA